VCPALIKVTPIFRDQSQSKISPQWTKNFSVFPVQGYDMILSILMVIAIEAFQRKAMITCQRLEA
jgi:hypothetical protein